MNSTIRRFDTERRFYVLAAIGIVVVVLAGFSIDYGLLFAPGSLSALVLVHALVMFGWIGLFFGPVPNEGPRDASVIDSERFVFREPVLPPR